MWIKSEDVLVNTNRTEILYIDFYDNGICKIMADSLRIGTYTDEETCRKVFEGIARALREEREFYDTQENFEIEVVD